MRGVVLAGGRGTRLRDRTGGANKHLLPLGGRAMIEYPIDALLGCGIDDITIVTSPEHEHDLRAHLERRSPTPGASFQIAIQRSPAGIADALGCAEAFTAGEAVCVILGDNVLERPIRAHAEAFAQRPVGAKVLLCETDEPERFAIASFEGADPGAPIREITEKPASARGSAAVIGVYFYEAGVYDVARSLEPSARGELEITDVNRAYLSRGELAHAFIDGWWVDAGTPEGLTRAESLLRRRERRA